MKIAIFSSLDGAPSIDRYARELARAFPSHVEVEVVSLPKRPGLRGKVLDKYLNYLRVARRTKADYNIIVSEGYAFLLLALDGARTLVVCHGVQALLYQDRQPPPGLWRLRYKFNLWMLRRAKHVVAVSESALQDLLKLCPFLAKKAVALHGGVGGQWSPPAKQDIARFVSERLLVGKRVILSVGNDSWYKNFEGIVGAFAALPQPDLVLVKVGETSQAQIDLVHRSGLQERVRFIPFADDDELRRWYGAASLLVFPSWHESFGWPPLEAMACGCPVVSSDRASLPEVCGDACLYVAPDDTAGITAAIERLLSDDASRAELSVKGRAQARRFDWHHTAGGMLRLLQADKG